MFKVSEIFDCEYSNCSETFMSIRVLNLKKLSVLGSKD